MSSLINYIEQFDDLTSANEIVFFGGSFNPWHDGHTTCIQLTPSHLPIIIIPDHNPFKEVVKKQDKLTSVPHIIERVKHLNRNIFVFDDFLKLNEKNPTYKWIEEVKRNFPLTHISLLLGYDNFETLPTWINAESLIKNLKGIYVASRLENDRDHELRANKIKEINPNIEIHFIGHHKHEHVTSTELRELQKKI